MTLTEVIELVRQVHQARSGPAAPARAAIGSVARLRAVLDAWEADVVGALASLGVDPEPVLATEQRVGWRDAGRVTDRAKVLEGAPPLRAALEQGDISGAHVDVVSRVLQGLDPQSRPALVERCGFLAQAATRSTPAAFARTVEGEAKRVRADDGMARFERQRRATRMRTWVDQVSGMWCGRFALDPATGLVVDARLQQAVESIFHDRLPDTCPADPLERQDHLRGLAFAALVTQAPRGASVGDGGAPAGGSPADRLPVDGPADRVPGDGVSADGAPVDGAPAGGVPCLPVSSLAPVDVTLVIDADHVDTDGTPRTLVDLGLPVDLPLGTVRELCRHAVIHPIVVRNGQVVGAPGRLNLGRTTRLANRAQRRALRALYRTCAIPGCEVGFRSTQPHHVIWWRNGGRTDLDNLLPVCVKHHHAIHDLGWHVKLLPDRSLVVALPDGTVLRTGPPRAPG